MFVLIIGLVFATTMVCGQPNLPSTLGCQAAEGGTVRCRGVPLGDVAHAFRILTSTPLLKVSKQNDSGSFNGDIYFRALAADVADCQIPELTTGSLKGPLVVVRIIRSKVGSVYPDAFQDQSSTLRILDLSDNELTAIPLAIANLEALRQLVLTNNRIAAVEPSSLFRYVRSLRFLDMSGNLLGVSSPENVRRANVGVRSATSTKEPESNNEDLGVKILRFDLRPATNNLKMLNLSRNHLQAMPELFYNNISFPNLEILDLGINKLHSLPVKFKPSETMPKLNLFNIRQNKLKMIHQENEPSEGDIDLSDNPIRCDCNSAWLLLRNSTNGTCGTPFALKGVLMSRLTTEDVCPGISSEMISGHQLVSLTTNNETSVIITWSVQSPGLKRHKKNESDLEWRILYRQLDADPYALIFSGIHKSADDVDAEAINQATASGDRLRAVFVDILGNLLPDTDYVVCLAAVKGSQFIMQRKRCRNVRTAEIIVTTPVSSAQKSEDNNVLATSGQIRVNLMERRAILTSLESTEDSITLSWSVVKSPIRKSRRNRATPSREARVEDLNAAKNSVIDGFVVSVREFGSFAMLEEQVTEDQKIIPLEEEVARSYEEHKRSDFQKRVNGLRANVAHQVCLRDLTTNAVLQTEDLKQFVAGENGPHPGEICKEIITGDQGNGRWPQGANTAVVACVTGIVTSIVVALVCFCWCGGGRGSGKDEKKGMNEKPNNIRGSSLTGTTLSVISGDGTNQDTLKRARRSLASTISSGSEKIIASIGGQKVNIGEIGDPFKTLPSSSGGQGRRRWLLMSPEEEENIEEKDLLRSLSPFHPRYSLPTTKQNSEEDDRSDRKSDSILPSPKSMWFKTPQMLNRSTISVSSEIGTVSGTGSGTGTNTAKSETNSSRVSPAPEEAIEYV